MAQLGHTQAGSGGKVCRKNKTDRNKILHISSSYAKILGETNFQPWEFPRSGSKAKDGKERKKEREKKRD